MTPKGGTSHLTDYIMIQVLDKKFKTYIPAAEVAEIVKGLAAKLSEDYKGRFPLMMPILNGTIFFAADLLRAMEIDSEVSFVKMSSYAGTQSSGQVKELIGFNENVKGRDVVLIEDVIETGISMDYTLKRLWEMKPASVKICTLVFKPHMFQKDFKIDYIGKEIGDAFIVGYGFDYNGHGRTYKDIYVLDED